MSVEKSPILNNPYEEPLYHYATIATGEEKGALDYTKIINGRRIFSPDLGGNSTPLGKKSQQENLFEVNDFAPEYGEHLIIEVTGMNRDKF